MKVLFITFFFAVAAFAADRDRCDLFVANVGCLRAQGNSGWLEFCPPTGTTTNAGDQSDADCVSLRPQKFAEVDNSVPSKPKETQSQNNLGSLSLDTVSSLTLPKTCTGSTLLCGWQKDGSVLNTSYITVSKSNIVGAGTGKLSITMYIIGADGTIQFGDQQQSVKKGQFKFTIKLTDYVFNGGDTVQLQLTVKSKGKDASTTTVTQNADGTSTVDGGSIMNFAKFAFYNNASSTATWQAATCTVEGKGVNTVIQYAFKGPFTSMVYDPTVALSGASTVQVAITFLCVFLTVLLF